MTATNPEEQKLDAETDEPEVAETEAGEQGAAEEAAEPEDELTRLQRERDEYLASWQRAQADYQNLRRRGSSDLEQRLKLRMQPLLESLLLVLDHLDMALMSPTESQDAQNLAIGVEMTRKQMIDQLEAQGVESIESSGSFDPALHQAVSKQASEEHTPGTILKTVRKGYTWNDGVLRFAQVEV
ncbi:MAG: nucleotide exchange factor GrpE, partial [Planctomycetota bacterium]